jgi:hypothetical protein
LFGNRLANFIHVHRICSVAHIHIAQYCDDYKGYIAKKR